MLRRFLKLAIFSAITATLPLSILNQHASAAEPTAAAPININVVSPQTENINKQIVAKWSEAGIKKPAARATDSEFLRRVFIDLIGRIPTVEEVKDFESDSSGNKRQKLVYRLLYSDNYAPKTGGASFKNDDGKELRMSYVEEFSDHWADIWTVWLMSRSAHKDYREKINDWLADQFDNNVNYQDFVKQLITAKGNNKDNGAVNFVMYHLGDKTPGEKNMQVGYYDAVPITSRVTRLFLGLQTQCTQCHDHPFNKEWAQNDFWGVNAFFRQTTRSGEIINANNVDRTMMANPPAITISDIQNVNADGVVFYERRDGKLMASKPEFLKDVAQADKGEKSNKYLDSDSKLSRRDQLAEFVLKHDNFSKAYINRIWGHLFGRGLNKEPGVDDFGSNNELVHSELIEELAKQFAGYKYDTKALLYWICTSDAYNLSHIGNKEYTDPKFDAFFARMPLKAMSPETLYRSLTLVTKSDEDRSKDKRRNNRQTWENKLVRTFGDDEGNEMTFNGTMVQALLMMNGNDLNGAISREEGSNPLIKLIQRNAKSGKINGKVVVEELFMMTVSRRPTEKELTSILAIRDNGAKVDIGNTQPGSSTPTTGSNLTSGSTSGSTSGAMQKPGEKKGSNPTPATAAAGKDKAGKGKEPVKIVGTVPATGPNDQSFYLDVFWALINTNEFMLNH